MLAIKSTKNVHQIDLSCLCFVKLPIYCASYQGPPLPTVRLSQTLFFGYLAGYSTWMELARHA